MPVGDLSRRRLLEITAGLGLVGALPGTAVASESSPDLEKFVQPLPIPEVREPDGKRKGADYHDVSIQEFERKAHPDLPPTTFWGFDGSVPGPIIKARRNERIKVRFDNSALPDEHLLEIDDVVHGTDPEDYDDYDGPVPDVRTSIHQHGLNVEWQSDGQAAAWKSPDGVTGPRFVKHVHDLPNRQDRMTASYHDHALGISRLNNYAGLNGFYVIESEQEEQLDLPDGDYDVPIMLQDRTFEEDGSLHYPETFAPNVAGDTAFVNGAVWPYMEVEPRRYRFRLVNQSNGRTFDLSLENDHGGDHGDDHDVPTLYQFAPDQGFLDEVVSIGHGGDMESLVIAPFERAEVVVDFSEYAGETFTLTNDAEFPFGGGHDGDDGGMDHGDDEMDHSDEDDDHDDGMDDDDGMDHDDGDHPELPELMQFRVAETASGVDDSAHPTDLDLPNRSGPDETAAKETRQMTLGMRMGSEPPTHVLNGYTFHEARDDIARPQLGTTEVWELENDSMHSHPIHLHLVTFEVIGRGEDGTEPPQPNERGPKDVVRVDPDETVRIVTKFENFAGKFPWHCHVLEHEEVAMMRPFEVVRGNSGGGKGRGRGKGYGHTDGKGYGHTNGDGR